ncbi:MAG: hypothetical protein ACPGD5_06375 [Salibacteraceae bacterium]
MKLIYTLAFSLSVFITQAQHFDIQYSMGTGGAFIVEDSQVDNLHYSAPIATYIGFKFTPNESFWNLKLGFQYMKTNVTGFNWEGGYNVQQQYYDYLSSYYLPVYYYDRELDGEVGTYTAMISIEHLKSDKKINLGFDVGMGLTLENFVKNRNYDTEGETNLYMSLKTSVIASFRLGKKTRLQLEPVAFWTNPYNSFDGKKYQMANEDLSLLLHLGVTYQLF